MKKYLSRIITPIIVVTLMLGTPIASKVIQTDVKADVYHLVWSDEFRSSSLDTSSWNYETGTGNNGWGNNELQYYTNRIDNVYLSNDCLLDDDDLGNVDM